MPLRILSPTLLLSYSTSSKVVVSLSSHYINITMNYVVFSFESLTSLPEHVGEWPPYNLSLKQSKKATFMHARIGLKFGK